MILTIIAALCFMFVSIVSFLGGGTIGIACGILFGLGSLVLIISLILAIKFCKNHHP